MMTWISRCSRLGVVAGGLVFCGSAGFAQAAPPPAGWPAQVQGIPDSLGVSLHLRGTLNPDGSVAKPLEQADLERQLEQIAALGLKIVRTDNAWRWVDQSKHEYDFKYHHRLVDECQKRGLRLLTILGFADRRYEKMWSIQSENGRKSYAEFCGRIAGEFKGKGIIWEMWNEPNIGGSWNPKADPAGYSAAIIGAMQAMKKADPDCVIIAPCACTMDYAFMESCFQQGILDYVSAVSLHPYSDAPETQMSRYLQLRNLILKYAKTNKGLPIVCSEWGYSELFIGVGSRIRSQDEQASLVVRSILVNQMSDVPMHIIYTNYDYDDKKEWNEACFGLMRCDKTTPKASYQAVHTLIKQLSGLKFKGQKLAGSVAVFEVPAGDYVAVFAGAGKTVVVVWTSGTPHMAKVQLPPGRPVAMVGMTGNALPVPPVADPGPGQYVTMEVKPSPVYIEVETPPDGGIGVGTK